jgi:AcrR family transcriptional regulator
VNRVADTRQRLISAVIATIRDHGVCGASARTIAATAGVNQALVFYHFGSVNDLLATACQVATEARVAAFRERLNEVMTLRELLALGRELHAEERALGNVTVLAQMLAAAQGDPHLAGATANALGLWIGPIEAALRRLLATSPAADLIDVPGLARAVSASFIGLELLEGVDPAGAADALGALDRLTALIDVVDDLGPVVRRALRAKLRRTSS